MITWEFCTCCGLARIKQFLDHRLRIANSTAFDRTTSKLLPGISWIECIFTFEVGGFRLGSGIFRLIPTPDGWRKGYTGHMSLTGLKDYLEKTGKEPPSQTTGNGWNNESAKSGVRGLGTIRHRRGWWTGITNASAKKIDLSTCSSLHTLRVQRSPFDWHGCGCGITRYNVGKTF